MIMNNVIIIVIIRHALRDLDLELVLEEAEPRSHWSTIL